MEQPLLNEPGRRPAGRTRYRYLTADVFTDKVFGGNPLAVFPEAAGLSDATMAAIARELNLSETVFVLPPADPANVARLRILTPSVELPFAGHPTIGAACVLTAIGRLESSGEQRLVSFEEGVGVIKVEILPDSGGLLSAGFASSGPPMFGPPPPARSDLAALLALEGEEVGSGPFVPACVSAGVPFVMIPVRDEGVLGRASLDLALWQKLLARAWAPHVYVLVPPAEGSVEVRARMFAPAMGIAEDPATGAAATALPTYFARYQPSGEARRRWVVRQGLEMGRSSRIRVEADFDRGMVRTVRVSGECVLVADAFMDVPAEC
jgi:trans-2,3-dihydro-3-hydroxyanthranilate isomerase